MLDETASLTNFGLIPTVEHPNGGYTVCIYCVAVLHFDGGLLMHEVTKPEFDKLDEGLRNELTRVRENVAVREKR